MLCDSFVGNSYYAAAANDVARMAHEILDGMLFLLGPRTAAIKDSNFPLLTILPRETSRASRAGAQWAVYPHPVS